MRVEHLGENVTLYLGDCREVLPSLSKGALVTGAVVTDPPYGMGKPFSNDEAQYADAVTSFVADWARKWVKGNVLAFWSAQRICRIGALFMPQRVMIWNKTFALYAPNNVGYRFELIVWVSGPGANTRRGDIFEHFPAAFKSQQDNTSHPTQKPLGLMVELIRDFTFSGTMVCDPFMGSGTTGVAAVKLARKFIGIEIEAKYFDIACRRIARQVEIENVVSKVRESRLAG